MWLSGIGGGEIWLHVPRRFGGGKKVIRMGESCGNDPSAWDTAVKWEIG